ncbi:FG-GAP-like repeat-containing protein [Oryzihumus sp.]|uniref:FG-GAP-like repeat-containing protein n=1 Tax=Oryzihumus sp. TaxID=1968903 RepID=UPI002ED84BE2
MGLVAAALTVAPLVTVGSPFLAGRAAPHPVKPVERTAHFVQTPVAQLAPVGPQARTAARPAAPDPVASARAAAIAPAQAVHDGVSVVGVSWPSGGVSASDTFQIRTYDAGVWGEWQTLDRDDSHGPDGAEAARASHATQPYVVTGATQFQVRALAADGTAPTAAQVTAIDPGVSDADSAIGATPPGSAAASAAKPTIYTRAQWGADESLRRGSPSFGQVQVGFVHHTDSTNSYTADQVPSIIRGIYAYHVESNGWDDIGYNFLVDRFGRIWEGRYGGMDQAVVGAHTLGYNSWSTGVSAIGNFVSASPPQAMVDAIKRVLAWKFTLSGIPATGTVSTFTTQAKDTFNRISGHRDAYQTTCPGQYLYDKLPEIRSGVAALMGYLPRSGISRDVDRNGRNDVLSYPSTGPTPAVALLSARREPVGTVTHFGAGWNALRLVSLSPDLTGDGHPDIVAEDPNSDGLRIYAGNGQGGVTGTVIAQGKGWNAFTAIVPAGDRNGDGHNDLLARTNDGRLVFYAGDGAGWFQPGVLVGTGWNAVRSISAVGDLNHDGHPDLLSVRTSDGALLMSAGKADGSLAGAVVWAPGWGSLPLVTAAGDLDGDGNPDLVARESDGVMRTYYGDSSGHLTRMNRWGAGWNVASAISGGVDWTGDGRPDVLAVIPASNGGSLSVYAGTGLRDLDRSSSFPTVPGADLVRLIGDVNGDGYVDAVARVPSSDTLQFIPGAAGGTFGTPRVIGRGGWNAMTLIEAAGDLDNDGVPDLIARDAYNNLRRYSPRRDLTFKPTMVIGTGWQGITSVVGAGAFNSDANDDLVGLRASDHALLLFRGAGPGILKDYVVLRSGQNDLAQLIAVGDYDGDGRNDVLARSTTGQLWLYTGNGVGGLNPGRQPVFGGSTGKVLG